MHEIIKYMINKLYDVKSIYNMIYLSRKKYLPILKFNFLQSMTLYTRYKGRFYFN